jgi:hypothetical protein
MHACMRRYLFYVLSDGESGDGLSVSSWAGCGNIGTISAHSLQTPEVPQLLLPHFCMGNIISELFFQDLESIL